MFFFFITRTLFRPKPTKRRNLFLTPSMVKKKDVTKEDFDTLLQWLGPNLEIAGQKYEKIRECLIRVLTGRGCCEAEELADETIDRVTQKSSWLISHYNGEPILYFYGVAHRVHLEWLRGEKKKRNLQLPPPSNSGEDEDDDEMEYLCLEDCIETLPQDHRQLVAEYYKEDGRNKIECRRELSRKSGLSINALHIKICRIRAVLGKCVSNCVAAKGVTERLL